MSTNPLIKLLREETKRAEEKEREEYKKRKIEMKEKETQEIKDYAENLFHSEVTKEKLLQFATTGKSEYPILFLKEDGHIVKNKKTGYKYNVGEAGEFLCDILEKNGFTPEIVSVSEYQLEDLRKLLPKIRIGIYLGIKW
jgi:hypothetical protein